MKKALWIFLLATALVASYAGISNARSGYLGDFNTLYGSANTRLDTCDTCHVAGGKSRNPYGVAVENGILAGKSVTQAMIDVQPNDSDSDTYANITEINGLYFPGDPNDHPSASAPIISLSTSTIGFGQVTVFGSVTLATDIQNSGNADLNVTSIGRCAGTSTEYTWSPDAPLTVAPGSSATLSVTYSPIDESTDAGCLEIASNDPDNATVFLALIGSGIVPLPEPVDIDISGFTATGRISLARVKPIALSLTVNNPGTLSTGSGSVTAALVGVQNSVTVYSQTIALDNIAAGATATFAFPGYTPTVLGTVTWTVTVNDTDLDSDTATAATKVVK